MHFGPALPTGFSSSSEYLDVDLTEDLSPDVVASRVSIMLPDGMYVLAAGVADKSAASLQQAVTAAEYVVALYDFDGDLGGAIDELVGRDELVVTILKKGSEREVDLRPGILAIEAGLESAVRVPRELSREFSNDSDADRVLAPHFWCRLATQPRNVRPTEVLKALSSAQSDTPEPRLVHRTAMLLDPIERELEPIPLVDYVNT